MEYAVLSFEYGGLSLGVLSGIGYVDELQGHV
jgi:hypothetical protein